MSKSDLKTQVRSLSKTREGTKVTELQQEFNQEEEQRPHTLTIRPSYIDRIKDYVYLRKIQGEPYFTQGDAVELALNLLFQKEGDIPARPEELKRKEKRRTGRKRTTSQKMNPPNSDPFI